MANERSLGQAQRRDRRSQLAALASSQYGIVSREQALALGFSPSAIDRRVNTGQWERVFSGVYRMPGANRSWYQKLMGAQIWGGEDAVLSFRSAGALLRLEGIAAGAVELTVPRHTIHPEIKLHFAPRLQAGDITTLGVFRLTSPSRTITDLARVEDAATIETVLENALYRGMTSIARLRWTLRTSAKGQAGTRVLTQLLDERDPKTRPTESVLETRLLRLIKESQLALPVPGYEVRDSKEFIVRLDFAYPDRKIAIEADGFQFHRGREKFDEDRIRWNKLTRRGWVILQVTWSELSTNPEQVIANLRCLLGEERLFPTE